MHHPDRMWRPAQALDKTGGKYFVGVNFGAMDKYREPLSSEQWKNCVASLKVPAVGLHAGLT